VKESMREDSASHSHATKSVKESMREESAASETSQASISAVRVRSTTSWNSQPRFQHPRHPIVWSIIEQHKQEIFPATLRISTAALLATSLSGDRRGPALPRDSFAQRQTRSSPRTTESAQLSAQLSETSSCTKRVQSEASSRNVHVLREASKMGSLATSSLATSSLATTSSPSQPGRAVSVLTGTGGLSPLTAGGGLSSLSEGLGGWSMRQLDVSVVQKLRRFGSGRNATSSLARFLRRHEDTDDESTASVAVELFGSLVARMEKLLDEDAELCEMLREQSSYEAVLHRVSKVSNQMEEVSEVEVTVASA